MSNPDRAWTAEQVERAAEDWETFGATDSPAMLPEGEAFEIDEYDGSESVTCRGRVDWWIA